MEHRDLIAHVVALVEDALNAQPPAGWPLVSHAVATALLPINSGGIQPTVLVSLVTASPNLGEQLVHTDILPMGKTITAEQIDRTVMVALSKLSEMHGQALQVR